MNALEQLVDAGLVWQTVGSGPKQPPNQQIAEFGIKDIDQLLPYGGLPFGHVHEWALETASQKKGQKKGQWLAPLFILSALLGRVISSPSTYQDTQKYLVVWIGRKCWPTPQLLERVLGSWNWQTHSIFLNPPCIQTRAWSISETLKNPAVLAVIADGSGFDTAMIRRAQLAAKRGNSLGLIARPPWEQEVPSTAYSRWSAMPAKTDNPQLTLSCQPTLSWQLTLRKIRGTLRECSLPLTWNIEWNEELSNGKGALCNVQTTSSAISRKTRISSAA